MKITKLANAQSAVPEMRDPSASKLTSVDLKKVEKHVPPELEVTFSGQEYSCNIMNKQG